MRFLATIRKYAPALALAWCFHAWAGEETNAPPAPAPVTARDFYNAGTKLLAAKKFAEAEVMFQTALANQDERVQPAALYNVGQARFSSGLERLRQGPDAQKTAEQGAAALVAGDHAIRQAETALAGKNMGEMIAAYLDGRGARRNLKEAEKAVTAAMETYGKTMDQWLRASDDFKGAAELNPADTNADYNAKVVDLGIAKLVDSVHKMEMMKAKLGKQRKDLGELLAKLKGEIPAPNAPPGAPGDDDEDNQGVTPESLAGKQENAGHEGNQMQIPLSPDQASQILSGLSLDGTRRLDMSDKESPPPKNQNGRIW